MQFTINLTAGQRWLQQTSGSYFLLMDTGAADALSLRLINGTMELEHVASARRGLKARMPGAQQFTAIEFTAAVACQCSFIISNGLVDIDTTDGATVNANLLGLPLPVTNDRGTPGNLMYVSGVSLADAPATTATDSGGIACGPAAVVAAAADATRRALRFINLGPDPVAIGAAGLTWAKRTIVLDVGDMWIEDRGANLAWSAITDAGDAATINVQEVFA